MRRAQDKRARIACLAALVALSVVAACGGGEPIAATGEIVILEPARSTGDDPFTSDLDLPARFDLDGAHALATSTGRSSEGGATVRGTAPGLYGGTRDDAVCDPDQLVDFLAENPAKAAAWAGVLGIEVDEIPDYVDELTPVVLLVDTRVTNHGFAHGEAYALQSVLQAGSAVLVDDEGVPRVRCACGNPLLEPRAQGGGVTFSGEQWATFVAGDVVTIAPGPPVESFTLADLGSPGEVFVRPAGTTGGDDVDDLVGEETTTSTTTTTAAATSTTTATTTTTRPRTTTTTTTAPATTTTAATSTTTSTTAATSTTTTTRPTTTTTTNPDVDGDGVLNADDNCPSTANPSQDDFDNDGVGDACDGDVDGDGDPNSSDCQDFNPAISSRAAEKYGNNVDENCDGKAESIVPDVEGRPPNDADALIESAGLVPSGNPTCSGPSTAFNQSPVGGSVVLYQSTVTYQYRTIC